MSRRIVATGVVAALAASFAPTGLPEVAGAATDVPGTVTEVFWQTNLPEEIGDVAAGGPGALAVQSHGVIAIDGTTGEQVWQYETGGAQAVTLLATPDGGTALLVTSSDGELAMVALDAATGEERFVTPYVQTELASPPPGSA